MDAKELSPKLTTKLRELAEKPEGWGDIRIIGPADARAILAALSDAAQAPLDVAAVYDVFSIGANVRTLPVLLENCRNARRRSDCLSGIEQLFTYETPDEQDPWETVEECDLNWGQERAEYVETFKAALPDMIARHPEYAAPVAPQAAGDAAQAPVAWKHRDNHTVMSDKQKRDVAEHNGSPGKRIADDFCIPLYAAPVPPAAVAPSDAEFKNFHRLLCDRFGYVHDEQDWRRDQLSLIEWIVNSRKKVASVQIEEIMDQAQVFASAWSIVGGLFDSGDALENAHQEKDDLRGMLRVLFHTSDNASAPTPTVAADAAAPTPQQISDYLHGLDAIQREVIEREARALRPSGNHFAHGRKLVVQPDELAAFEKWAKTKNMDLTPFETTFDSDFTSNAWDGWQARATATPALVVLTNGMDRAEFHDKAWSMWHAKALDSALLPKLSIHAIRTLWDVLYDAMPCAAVPQAGATLTDQEILRIAEDNLEMGDLLRSMRTDHIYGEVQVVPFARALLAEVSK